MTTSIRPTNSPLAAAARLAFVLTSLAAVVALASGCDQTTEGADDRADHRCGPDFEEAKCGANRCCSSSGFCGSLDQTHCGAANGFGGAYDGPRVTSGGPKADCAGFCARQAAVVAELGCTDARTEETCLSECAAAEADPAAESCDAEFVAQVACVATAPTEDFSCPTEPGVAPSLEIGQGSACGDEVGALVSCLFSSN